MPTRPRFWLPLFALLALTTSVATADSDVQTNETRDRRDRSAVSVNVGLFTPTGGLGVEYAHAFHQNAELGVGAGLGYLVVAALDHSDGRVPAYRVRPEVSIMPRLRTRVGMVRFAVGAGVSAGSFQDSPSPFSDDDWREYAALALWANGEASTQLIFRNGWFGAVRLGGSYLVTHTTVHSTGDAHMPEDPQGLAMPYLGLSAGRTL